VTLSTVESSAEQPLAANRIARLPRASRLARLVSAPVGRRLLIIRDAQALLRTFFQPLSRSTDRRATP
jgi:hypothetical protein